jgi:hypothetical protein
VYRPCEDGRRRHVSDNLVPAWILIYALGFYELVGGTEDAVGTEIEAAHSGEWRWEKRVMNVAVALSEVVASSALGLELRRVQGRGPRWMGNCLESLNCEMIIARIGAVNVFGDVGVDVSCLSRCSTFRNGLEISAWAISRWKAWSSSNSQTSTNSRPTAHFL